MKASFFPRLINGPFGDPACYVRLVHQRRALLFDCGELHSLAARDALKIRQVFISHAHIDHLIGLDALLRLFLYRPERLQLFGPPGLIGQVTSRFGGYTWNLVSGCELELEVIEWGDPVGRRGLFSARKAFVLEGEEPCPTPGGLLLEDPHLRVAAVPLGHGDIPSLAYLLEEPLHVAIHKDALDRFGFRTGPWLGRLKALLRSGAPGETLLEVPGVDGGMQSLPVQDLAGRITHVEPGIRFCYVTDVAPTEENCERIVSLARGAHILVIEATFLHQDLARAVERNHLTAWLAGDLAGRAQIGRLILCHHSARYQGRGLDFQREAQAAFHARHQAAGTDVAGLSPAAAVSVCYNQDKRPRR